jgi:nitrate/TMAO reductase-like tetraheme cytochrome c subunit
MRKKESKGNRQKIFWFLVVGFITGVLLMFCGNKYLDYTSTDEYCMSCHIHPMPTTRGINRHITIRKAE